jgi:hypothetical protein
VAHPVRYVILDDAVDQPALWHLTNRLSSSGEGMAEIRPGRAVDELRPHLMDLLREGHIEVFLFREPQSPALPLDQALAAVADDSNWTPQTTATWYGVITTESGERELVVERKAYHREE